MNTITMKLQADHLIEEALREDISSEDVTTNSVMKKAVQGEVNLICKQDGIIAGLEVFKRVFELLDANTKIEFYKKDGDAVKSGELLGVVTGDIRVLLSGERVALNYLQRMSGIATYTNSVAKLLAGTKTKLLDTRKTTPNMRIFEKYAVRVGGGYNHRYNLSDGVLLKDNHIGAAGSVTKAIQMAKDYAPFVRKIEVEVENLEMVEEALAAADEIGLPVLMRPSYVLGGQNMIVAYNKADIIEYMGVITKHVDMSHPVLMDKYILGTECEVDAICDGTDYLVPGIMQQVERTGVHSGDSICVYPPYTFSQKVIDTLVDYTGRFARELKVVGLVNVQYAVQNDRVYVIEVNPRSSRTVPYISKVTGVPMVDLAVRCTLGEKLKDMGYGTGLWRKGKSPYYAVKVPVYSFLKLHGVDTMLGPEMKSTGEVLGIAPSFHEAMMKGLVAAGYQFKTPGPGSCVIISVKDSDKAEAAELAWKLHDYGYKIYGTPGTAKFLNSEMVPCSVVRQMSGARPNVIDLLESGLVDYIISTSPHGRDPHRDSVKFRRKATELSIPTITAMDTARVLVDALRGDHDISQMELVDIANLHREAAKGE